MIHRYTVTSAGQTHEVEVEAQDGGAVRVVVDGQTRLLDAREVEGGVWSLLASGQTQSVTVGVEGQLPSVRVNLGGLVVAAEVVDARSAHLSALAHRTGGAGSGEARIKSPMPGRIVKLLCREGDEVAAGAGVVVVEAMKMENELRAPRAGTIKTVRCREGEAVESGQELVVLA